MHHCIASISLPFFSSEFAPFAWGRRCTINESASCYVTFYSYCTVGISTKKIAAYLSSISYHPLICQFAIYIEKKKSKSWLTKLKIVSQHLCLLLKVRLHSKAYKPSLPWCLEDSIWKCVTKGAMQKSDTLLLPRYFLCLSHGWNNAMQRMGNYIYVLISLKQCIVRDVGTCRASNTIKIQNYKYKKEIQRTPSETDVTA